jgi:hypothetical protein
VLLPLVFAALGLWFLVAPESARRAGIALNRPFGRTADPPRAIFVRLIGLTWLLLLGWSLWTESR